MLPRLRQQTVRHRDQRRGRFGAKTLRQFQNFVIEVRRLFVGRMRVRFEKNLAERFARQKIQGIAQGNRRLVKRIAAGGIKEWSGCPESAGRDEQNYSAMLFHSESPALLRIR